jgi:hypothetical protein
MSDNSDIKAKYQRDMDVVRALMNQYDPCGLINAGAPSDEYDCMNGGVLRMVYDKKPRQEIREYMVHEIEHHFGTPDLSVLDEPYKSEFFRDLDEVLDGVENHFANKVPQ